ncbi:MAG: aminopeptidase P N-terminal domain-containing protein [Solirubrobacteraceae bacterium]
MSDAGAQLERRRRAAADRWSLDRELVVIGAGDPVPVPGRGDITYPFRSHSEYFYLTDRQRPGGVLVFDPDDGWTEFVVPVSREELLWEGGPPDGDLGEPIALLEPWLTARAGRPLASLGSPVDGLTGDPTLTDGLRRGLNHVRRPKDAVELERMRVAGRATRAGFAAVVELLAAGRTERQLQIELEAEFLRNGADAIAYDSIVGSGPNSAVLHFAPSTRELRDGELVLIDAGAEYRGYACDVTRTYSVGGRFAAEQAALHSLVERAMQAATEKCKSGVEFSAVHRSAALVIAEGLADLRLLRGAPETLLESGAVLLFFPHGVGHMVGLGVRDASEVLPGREPAPGMPRLRVDLPLMAGHVVTIEPGIYFVGALLSDPEARARHRQTVNWERVDQLLGFGGIRLENDVLVTDDGFEVLTGEIPISAG